MIKVLTTVNLPPTDQCVVIQQINKILEVSISLEFGSSTLIFRLREPFSGSRIMLFTLEEPENGFRNLEVKAGEPDMVPVMRFSHKGNRKHGYSSLIMKVGEPKTREWYIVW